MTLRLFKSFRDAVYRRHLHLLWTMKPILKGDRVIKLLGIKKPTLYVHRILCELVVWQILNLKGTSVDPSAPRSASTDLTAPSNLAAAEAYVLELDATQKARLHAADYPPREF